MIEDIQEHSLLVAGSKKETASTASKSLQPSYEPHTGKEWLKEAPVTLIESVEKEEG